MNAALCQPPERAKPPTHGQCQIFPCLLSTATQALPTDDRLLALISFGAPAATLVPSGLPQVVVGLPQLGSASVIEVWRGQRPAVYGEQRGIRYADNGELLFGSLSLAATDVKSATATAYHQILGLLAETGYTHLQRVWHYFPDINEDDEGLERYQQFCLGRHQALAEAGYVFGTDLPAASAIGSEGGELCMYFIAARQPGHPIENPRQLSAYHYPRRYGPRSPSFSRAMLLPDGGGLFISGTASISGHTSVHTADIVGQCQETLANIRAILAQTTAGSSLHPSGQAAWKIYLRHAGHHATVRGLLTEALGPGAELLFLQGDICRSELLLEIEAVISLRDSPPVR